MIDDQSHAPALVAVVVLLALLTSSCVWGDSVESQPHGLSRTEAGELTAVSCPQDRGIQTVELVPEGSDPNEWDDTVLELELRPGADALSEVPLEGSPRGYELTRKASLGAVLVTVFDATRGNLLLTTWSTDLDDLDPGFVATRDGHVSRSEMIKQCKDAA